MTKLCRFVRDSLAPNFGRIIANPNRRGFSQCPRKNDGLSAIGKLNIILVLLENNATQATQGLFFTVLLGLYFTALQAYEYLEAPFTIADSAYGSTFFVATGFHGLHVIIGTLF
jgi:hypothetical protein